MRPPLTDFWSDGRKVLAERDGWTTAAWRREPKPQREVARPVGVMADAVLTGRDVGRNACPFMDAFTPPRPMTVPY